MPSRTSRDASGDAYTDPQVVEGNIYPFEESGNVGEPTPTTRRGDQRPLTETGEIRLAQITDEVRRAAELSQGALANTDETFESSDKTVAFDAAAVAQALQEEAAGAVDRGKAQTGGIFADIAEDANNIFEGAAYVPEEIDRQALAAAALPQEQTQAAEDNKADTLDAASLPADGSFEQQDDAAFSHEDTNSQEPKPVLGGAYAAAGQAQDLVNAGMAEEPAEDTEEGVDLSQFRGKYASLNEISGTHPTIHFESEEDAEAGESQLAEEDHSYTGFAGFGIVDPSMLEDVPEGDVQVHPRELSSAAMYDDLVNWGSKLTQETPLFQRAVSLVEAKRVCDVGCGSGRRAALFAQWGLRVLGLESNAPMLERAQSYAAEIAEEIEQVGGSLSFARGVLGSVAAATGPSSCDIIVCANGLLPKVDSLDILRSVLDDLANALVPAGVLILEFANHIRYEQNRVRTTTPVVFDAQDGTKLFLGIMDYPAGSEHIGVNMLTLTSDEQGQWHVRSEAYQELAMTPLLVERELIDAGFDIVEMSGDYNGRPLDQQVDESMIIIARRKRHRAASQLRREQP